MVQGRQWTGFEAVALQEAMRKSVREYAGLLGVETTTITNWRSGLGTVTPRSRMQEILDTTLELHATPDDTARFEQIVMEGEEVWRQRHRKQPSERSTSDPSTMTLNTVPLDRHCAGQPAPSQPRNDIGIMSTTAVTAGEFAGEASGISQELIDVLGRVHALSRSINPEIIYQLQRNMLLTIAAYETLDHAALVPALMKQRIWIDELLSECNNPQQRRQLYEIASETSGLQGYIAVGRGDFPLARAYCLESFQLSNYTQDPNLMAWARGIQSFCEYYAGHYGDALEFAEEGINYAGAGPQSVRLAINGVARSHGKLGNGDGVNRAIDLAHEMMARNTVPLGVPSSISLACYSAAQVASNAATAYVSLGLPDQVERYTQLALPDIAQSDSPWSRSLVAIDMAASHIRSRDGDLEYATTMVLDALDISAGRPIISVQRRATEFVRDAVKRWGASPQLTVVREAVSTFGPMGTHG
jgi:hypothetical protein